MLTVNGITESNWWSHALNKTYNVLRDDTVWLLLLIINAYHSAAADSFPNCESEIKCRRFCEIRNISLECCMFSYQLWWRRWYNLFMWNVTDQQTFPSKPHFVTRTIHNPIPGACHCVSQSRTITRIAILSHLYGVEVAFFKVTLDLSTGVCVYLLIG